MRNLKIEVNVDGICTLTLDSEKQSTNTVNDGFIEDMEEAIGILTNDQNVKGVILTSGKSTFMVGADLKQLVRGFDELSVQEAYAFSQRASRMHRAIERSGKPWVAALNGHALGGGFELALACHHRILVDDKDIQVGLPEVTVGLMPGSGGTVRLALAAGLDKALDLLLSGRSVAPQEALAFSIVDEVVPTDQLLARAQDWLATNPSHEKKWDVKGWLPPHKKGLTVPEDGAYYAMAIGKLAKRGYHYPAPHAILANAFEGLQLPFDKALEVESQYFAKLLTDPVARNIIRTTFISRQAAKKGARRPAIGEKSIMQKIGVIGAGMMGAGIAYVAAKAGIEVILLDRDQATAERGKAYTDKILAKLLGKNDISEDAAKDISSRITATTEYDLLEQCSLVIEAVFEDVGIKADTTCKAEAIIPPTAVFASNTSTLPISQLAKASLRPDKFIGLHFFSPVDRMELVEVIVGEATSDETLARALDFVGQLGKLPIVVNDSRGFYTSRVFQTFIHEGAAMLAEGVPPSVIENAAKAVGMPTGPLALLDELTFDLPLKIVDQAIAEEGSRYTPPAGTAILRKMKDDIGRSGRKTGGGFYEYPEEASKHLWKGLHDHFPVKDDYDLDEIKQRFLYAQAVETIRCMEEGVIATPQDADLGAIYGWGFPRWTGGTISYADTVGISNFVSVAEALAQKYGPRFKPSSQLRDMAARGQNFYATSGNRLEKQI